MTLSFCVLRIIGRQQLYKSEYNKATDQKNKKKNKKKNKNKKRQQKYAKGPYYELRFIIVELQFY